MSEFLDMVKDMTVADAIELNKKAQESMGDPTIFD